MRIKPLPDADEVVSEPTGRVTIIYKSLPHYRVAFYEGLRESLAERGVRLRLIVGQPTAAEATKKDTGAVAWAERVRNRALGPSHRHLLWQPILGRVRGEDLVVVEQASRLVANYALLGWQFAGGPRIALWGHGINMQENPSSLGEAVKRQVTNRAHWFFAYTEGTSAIAQDMGVEASRITVVRNSIDTVALIDAAAKVTEDDVAETRRELEITSPHVGLFVGSLYTEKRLRFLIESSMHIREDVPDFELIVIGDGPERDVIREAELEHEWIHWVGALNGDERIRYFKVAQLVLMPGLVGLVALDALALETPMVTTNYPFHSPEFEYLEDGVNAVVVPDWKDPTRYSESVIELLRDPDRLERLRAGCTETRGRYTMAEMVGRFSDGIVKALGAARQ